MPTYVYKCPVHGEIEVEHSMSDLLEICPRCIDENKAEPEKVVRLISGGTSFTLVGGGWAKDNYK